MPNVISRLHFLYPDELWEASYGRAELADSESKLIFLAEAASGATLSNTLPSRIGECGWCHYTALCWGWPCGDGSVGTARAVPDGLQAIGKARREEVS